MSIISYLFNLLPIHRDKVVFYTFSETYADQPKYIAEELQRRKLPLKLVWISEHKRVSTPRGIRSVCGRYLSRYHLATARVIIANHRLNFYWPKGYIKKPGQTYLQTWHGSYGIKKMEADVHTPSAAYINKAKLDSRQIDYLISNSKWLTDIYRACFFYSGSILETGSPRNDLLFHPGDTAARVRRDLGIPSERKLLLFAPTFRDGAESELPPMPEFPRLRAALSTRFGGEWTILVRLHPGRCKNPKPLVLNDEHVIDVSSWPDTAELLAAADAMVSDYSSCIFDYLLTGRPAFIYAPDADTYATKRGLYYPLSDTPFPLAENFSSLIYNVENFDEQTYKVKIEKFLRDKGGCDRGDATHCVVSVIEKELLKKVSSMSRVRKNILRQTGTGILKGLFSIREVDADYKELRLFGLRFKYMRKWPKPPSQPYANLPIQHNKIVFRISLNGYACNAKYIAEEIIRRKLPYDLVWYVGHRGSGKEFFRFRDTFPASIRLVMEGSEEADIECSTAKVLVETIEREPLYRRGIHKKKGQFCIQTWHGSFGIKTVPPPFSPIMMRWFKASAGDIDYLISNSKFETEHYHKPLFWHKGVHKGKILEWGHPRNDILYAPDKEERRRKILDSLGISHKKKVILWAPTFRGNSDLSWASLDGRKVCDAMRKRFGGEWIFATRIHHILLAHRAKLMDINDGETCDWSGYADMQELLLAADALISDYSASIIDFMLLRRPAFLYAPDRSAYEKGRSVSYPLSRLPFPLAENNMEMEQNIITFDEALYQVKVEDFLKRVGCVEDGHASERVVDLIQKLAPVS